MVRSTVSSKRADSALDVVGKGLLVGLLVGASSLTQASLMTSQTVQMDVGGCGGSESARHGGSRASCSGEVGGYAGAPVSPAGSVVASFAAPANFSGAISIVQVAQLTASKPVVATPTLAPPVAAPGPVAAVVAPVVTAPIAVVAPVPTQQIVAAAPPTPTTPTTPATTAVTTQPAVTTVPSGTNNPLPAPSIAAFAVPEPSTIGLLLGGFIALIGIRSRAGKKR